MAYTGWQDYAISHGSGLTKLDPALTRPSYALGILGMPGFTAYHGLLHIGEPKAGETVVVVSACGPVGAVVGQIAKIKGCRVIGIAGGEEKCGYVVEELGFDICLDRYDPEFSKKLAAVCPDGVDVYFENVGGAVFDAVLPLLNVGARIPVCGLIAHYNDTALPAGPDCLPSLMSLILIKRFKVQGFLISDHYATSFDPFFRQMTRWVAENKVKLREDVVDGLEHAPQALIGMLQGDNFGKLVVRVASN